MTVICGYNQVVTLSPTAPAESLSLRDTSEKRQPHHSCVLLSVLVPYCSHLFGSVFCLVITVVFFRAGFVVIRPFVKGSYDFQSS